MSQNAPSPSPSMSTKAPFIQVLAKALASAEHSAPGTRPLVPPHLQWVAVALGSALFAGGFLLPEAWQPYAATAGSLAYFLAGLGWKAPAWAPKKPLLPLTLMPLALSASEFIEVLQPGLSESSRPWMSLLSGLLAMLAGKVLPEPLVPAAAPRPVPPQA